MTPAKKPKAKDKNFVFVLEAKNAVAPPIPVAKPAINVSPNAIKTFSVIFFSPACLKSNDFFGLNFSFSNKTIFMGYSPLMCLFQKVSFSINFNRGQNFAQ